MLSTTASGTAPIPTPNQESVIPVFSNPVITWTLTVILLLSTSYHLLQVIRSRQIKDQINNGFHSLMHILMAGMLWHFECVSKEAGVR